MAKRPAASFEVIPLGEIRPVIDPPSHLNAAEKALFHQIVQSAGPLAFVKTDAQLLGAYVQACCLTALAYESALSSPSHMINWVRASKTMMLLAGKLRLCPSARVDPRTLSRAYAGRSYHQPGVSLEGLATARDGTSPSRDWKARS